MKKHLLHAEKSIAIYPGSFDPITNGHLDIIERATFLFDEVYVLVAHNPAKSVGMFTPKERVAMIGEAVGKPLLGTHVKVDYMRELMATVDVCTRVGARAMIRGLRSITDFDSEFELAIANMELAEHIETIFMVPQPHNHFISSSKVREIFKLKGPKALLKLVPTSVMQALEKRAQQ